MSLPPCRWEGRVGSAHAGQSNERFGGVYLCCTLTDSIVTHRTGVSVRGRFSAGPDGTGRGGFGRPRSSPEAIECLHVECGFRCLEERSVETTAAPNSVSFQMAADATSLSPHLSSLLAVAEALQVAGTVFGTGRPGFVGST